MARLADAGAGRPHVSFGPAKSPPGRRLPGPASEAAFQFSFSRNVTTEPTMMIVGPRSPASRAALARVATVATTTRWFGRAPLSTIAAGVSGSTP